MSVLGSGGDFPRRMPSLPASNACASCGGRCLDKLQQIGSLTRRCNQREGESESHWGCCEAGYELGPAGAGAGAGAGTDERLRVARGGSGGAWLNSAWVVGGIGGVAWGVAWEIAGGGGAAARPFAGFDSPRTRAHGAGIVWVGKSSGNLKRCGEERRAGGALWPYRMARVNSTLPATPRGQTPSPLCTAPPACGP